MSDSPSITSYVKTLFYRNGLKIIEAPDGFVRRNAIEESIINSVNRLLGEFDATGITPVDELAAEIFDEMSNNSLVMGRSDHFAGDYFKYMKENVGSFRNTMLNANRIHELSQEMGSHFFGDVFGAYIGEITDETRSALSSTPPRQDIIVTLSSDQIRNYDDSIESLISDLEANNGVPDAPGVKERILGQIRAGRELIRAGAFRAHLLHVTLIGALGEIIKLYTGHAIAMVAASLVDLIVKNALGVA